MPKRRSHAAYLTRSRWTIVEARAALSALKTSGLSVAAFAAREGLDAQRLYGWRRRLEREVHGGAHPEFVELRPSSTPPIEIVLRSGRTLRVSESVDPPALARLVAALEQSEPC